MDNALMNLCHQLVLHFSVWDINFILDRISLIRHKVKMLICLSATTHQAALSILLRFQTINMSQRPLSVEEDCKKWSSISRWCWVKQAIISHHSISPLFYPLCCMSSEDIDSQFKKKLGARFVQSEMRYRIVIALAIKWAGSLCGNISVLFQLCAEKDQTHSLRNYVAVRCLCKSPLKSNRFDPPPHFICSMGHELKNLHLV